MSTINSVDSEEQRFDDQLQAFLYQHPDLCFEIASMESGSFESQLDENHPKQSREANLLNICLFHQGQSTEEKQQLIFEMYSWPETQQTLFSVFKTFVEGAYAVLEVAPSFSEFCSEYDYYPNDDDSSDTYEAFVQKGKVLKRLFSAQEVSILMDYCTHHYD